MMTTLAYTFNSSFVIASRSILRQLAGKTFLFYIVSVSVIFALMAYYFEGLVLTAQGSLFSFVEFIIIGSVLFIPPVMICDEFVFEKEFKTLSMLLTAPVPRIAVLIGKLFAVTVVWGIAILYTILLSAVLMPEVLQEFSFIKLTTFILSFLLLGASFGSIGLLTSVFSNTKEGATSSSTLIVIIAAFSTFQGFVFEKAGNVALANVLLYLSPFSYAIDASIYPILRAGVKLDLIALLMFTLFFLFVSTIFFERQDVLG